MHDRDFRLPRKRQNVWFGSTDSSNSYRSLSLSIGPEVFAEPAAAVGEHKFVHPLERAFAGSCVIDGQLLHIRGVNRRHEQTPIGAMHLWVLDAIAQCNFRQFRDYSESRDILLTAMRPSS